MLREDYRAYDLNLLKLIISVITLRPFCLIVLYRLSSWLHRKGIKVLPGIINALGIALFGADIAPGAVIGGGLRIAHTVGIVIGYDVVIGKNAHIFHNVTIGSSKRTKAGRSMPTLGNGVSVFTGAVVIGPIRIGDNSSIGANAVVTKDFPSNVVLAGVPAQVISRVKNLRVA